MLKNIDSDIALSMAYVRRTHNVQFEELATKMSGVKMNTLKKYMQPSYSGQRPIHVVAGFSWVMMVPMTAFYFGMRLKEYYRGMEDSSVEALVRIGRLPKEQFNAILDIITNLYSEEERHEFREWRESIEALEVESGVPEYNSLFPPEVLDIDAFGEDYYRSIAITLKQFRYENNVSEELAARVLGLSEYQYRVLENRNKPISFSVAIGFRAKLGFQLQSHTNFTNSMIAFPQFHHLRVAQHVRDTLIVEAIRRLEFTKKQQVSKIIDLLSEIYL
ncbi:hypothetical protein ACFSJZ_01255 [Veronia pacifica]